MKLKGLEEKRSEILSQLEEENKAETRSVEKVEELLKKLDEVKKEIEVEERLLEVMENKVVEKKVEVRDYNAEIRSAIENEKELDITNFEVEERGVGVGATQGKVNTTTQNIAKKTFANQILKKAEETSELMRYVRTENFGSATHQIPVQKDKIGKFANVKELADYVEKNIDFTPINMSAHKYGNITVVSEEALADTGYDIMSELLTQYSEGAGQTLDELLVTGDAQVEGLNKFVNTGNGNVDTGAKKVELASADIADQEKILEAIMAMYNSLPRKYAKNATWVIGTDMAAKLTSAVDGVGRPLLYTDFTQVPFGGKATPMLLGRPVVISDHVNVLTAGQHNPLAFFGQLDKALILGLRQNFTIKTSTEYGFINDGVAIKGQMRFDIKKGLAEALAVMVKGA